MTDPVVERKLAGHKPRDLKGARGDATSSRMSGSDESFVARIRAHDRDPFEALFREHAGPLRSYAMTLLGSGDDAADVVQDVFVRIWDRGAQWRSAPRAYLYAAVRNGALNRLRNGARRAELDREEWESHGPHETVVELFRDDERDPIAVKLAECAEAIHKLPAKHRQVFVLRWEHRLSYAEIAQILDIPIKTVESRIGKALKIIRRECLR